MSMLTFMVVKGLYRGNEVQDREMGGLYCISR